MLNSIVIGFAIIFLFSLPFFGSPALAVTRIGECIGGVRGRDCEGFYRLRIYQKNNGHYPIRLYRESTNQNSSQTWEASRSFTEQDSVALYSGRNRAGGTVSLSIDSRVTTRYEITSATNRACLNDTHLQFEGVSATASFLAIYQPGNRTVNNLRMVCRMRME